MTYTLHLGDCLDVMRGMPANSVDTVVTDPPYGLAFMGKDWDFGVPGVAFWAEALRVAKPGAMLLAFGGTRTFHRLTCAIEDAGWEVRDSVMWLYGSGFPKSHDISKAIDKAAGAEREVVGIAADFALDGAKRKTDGSHAKPTNQVPNGDRWSQLITAPATDAARTWQGWGTALKPAWEPIILAMKTLDGTFANNAQAWGVAGLNVDVCRINVAADEPNKRRDTGGYISGDSLAVVPNAPYNHTRAATLTAGRWPANLILDEDAAVALDAASGERRNGGQNATSLKGNGMFMNGDLEKGTSNYAGDTGGASRFFYVAKASRAERNAGLEGMEGLHADAHNLSSNACARCGKRVKANGSGDKCDCGELRETIKLPTAANHHPTVKPLALMRYLVRLTSTPTGGIVLDPFMGSGTTGVACMMEGRQFIGIELDPNYLEIARRRIESVQPALVGA